MIKVVCLTASGVIHDHHGWFNNMAKNPHIDLTAIIAPNWPYHRGGTSFFKSLFGTYKSVNADEMYFNKKDRVYEIIKKMPLFPGKTFYFYPTLFFMLNRLNPDVIHISCEPEYAILTQTILWKKLFRKKTKIVVFTHENMYYPYKDRLFYNLFIYKVLERFNLKNFDGATLATNEVGGLLRLKGFHKPTIVVGNQVDVDFFKKKDVSKLKKRLGFKDEIVIGYFSRIEESKGILTIIRALGKIKDKKFKLLVVGRCEEDFMIELKEKISSVGITDKVVFVSEVPRKEVVDYMNCSDMIIMGGLSTKTWVEQFGRVNAESMACEVPVIGSSSGGIPEAVSEGGLIFKEDNDEDLKNKIGKLMEDAGLRKKLGKLGRQRVLNNYSNKKSAENTLKLFERLLHKKLF
ncbi:MAG: glycosyltransferase family 4 protein [archaeon]